MLGGLAIDQPALKRDLTERFDCAASGRHESCHPPAIHQLSRHA
tara:strand:+ start:676 stop:807 length:132 start_codon:yes stop_codon:yes gene_type:complete